MKSVYETSFEYFGYRIFFHFSDPMEAVKLKEAIEEIRPDIELKIKHYKVMERLPDTFVNVIKEIIEEVDRKVEERRKNESLSLVPCETSDE